MTTCLSGVGLVHKVHEVHNLSMSNATNTAAIALPNNAEFAIVNEAGSFTAFAWRSEGGLVQICTEARSSYTDARTELEALAHEKGWVLHYFQGEHNA